MKAGVITLRSIELAGFKSFAKRTNIEFGEGLVGIVGPNGSGKSNIADAVRWVFGEQKNKSLRSDKSEDLIYHGGDGKARASMAEVTVRLDNSDGKIPIDLNQIEISRRLYRSGENSYLLNGRKVSLASIQELLSKAGFGIGSYTVIGQGMIDRLILATGQERKQLFEEASGIKHYEIKIAQTTRKLEATKENLNQINALISELRPEWESLQKQQGFLKKRTELTDELAAKRLAYINSNLDALQSDEKSQKQLLQKLSASLSEVNNRLKHLESEKPQNKQSSSDIAGKLEKELTELDSRREKLEARITEINLDIQLLEQSNDSKLLQDKLKSDLADAQSATKDHYKEQQRLKKEAGAFENKIEALDSKIAAQTKLLDQHRRTLSKSQKSEYLKHSLGLIDILQDSVRRNRSYDELSLVFYKLRRVIKHSLADNSAELALKVGRIQNSISTLLGEKERLSEKQTTVVIKLRASEMDSATIAEQIKSIDQQLKAISSVKHNDDAKRLIKLKKELRALESSKNEINHRAELSRDALIELAKQSESETDDTYYKEHERLNGESIVISQQIGSVNDAIEKINESVNYHKGLHKQWFGTTKASIKPYDGRVELQELERLVAEIGLIQEIDPKVGKVTDEAGKRMEFLQKQKADLEKAMSDLDKIIRKSEVEMQKVFKGSFDKINHNFAASFTKLFGGGKAELRLEPKDDGFGIEIEVQLPSKKSQNLTSLSGGEKALSSVALLSAILRSNPSPFVVLDEVDAALDEANTKKFADVISEITKHSQILVITHNHETMSAASELVGVTTSGNNDSHIIRVRLDNLPVGAAH